MNQLPHYAQMIQCTSDQFNNDPRNANTLKYEQLGFPASVLSLYGYHPFNLIKNDTHYEYNPFHFRCGNDLIILDDRYYDDELNKVAYFYLRCTSTDCEYINIPNNNMEYYIIVIDRKQL